MPNASAAISDKWFGGDRPRYSQIAADAFGNSLANAALDLLQPSTVDIPKAGKAIKTGKSSSVMDIGVNNNGRIPTERVLSSNSSPLSPAVADLIAELEAMNNGRHPTVDPTQGNIKYEPGSSAYQAEVAVARQYSPELDALMTALENSEMGNLLWIKPLDGKNTGFDFGQLPEPGEEFDPDYHSEPTIRWNPREGNKLVDGSVQSPALVLLHEIAHAAGYMANNDAYFARKAILIPGFTDAEELNVIRNIETPMARSLHEPVRNYHSGASAVAVDSVTYSLNLQNSSKMGIHSR